MEWIIALSLLAVVPATTLISAPEWSFGNAFWINESYGIAIQIEERGRGISVREGRLDKWREYRFVRPGYFDDFRGSTIRFYGNSSLVWKSRRHRRVLKFFRVQYSSTTDRFREHGIGNPQAFDRREDLYSRSNKNRFPGISGIWRSRDGRHRVEFEMTDKGLRARRNKDESWVYYESDPHENNVYYDSRRNQFMFSDDKCTWLHRTGRNKIIFHR